MNVNDPNWDILAQSKLKLFYVYVYLNPLKPGKYEYGEYSFNYEPYYVGKGNSKGKRINDHYTRALRLLEEVKFGKKMGKQTHKNNTTIQIIKNGSKPIQIKLHDNLLDCQAIKKEIQCIKTIGRYDLKTGPLTNMTEGGEGTVGRVCLPETRKKMSLKKKGTCINENNSRARFIYVYDIKSKEKKEFRCGKMFIDYYNKKGIILTKSNVSKYAYLNESSDKEFSIYKNFIISFKKINIR